MNTISAFLRFLLGIALVAAPISAEAKGKKGQGKARAAQSAQARPQAPKASPQRTANRKASRHPKMAKAPARRDVSKPARSQPSKGVAKQRRVSPSAKRAPALAKSSPAQGKSRAKRTDLQKDSFRDLPAVAETNDVKRDVTSAGKPGRNLEKADRNVDKPGRDKADRADARADRREARTETAQERERRDQRVRERERISPERKDQIAKQQERRRERVERFRDNRQRRFAAVQRQRRALRATQFAARREYAREVREEIREYWEDRADEIRDRVRDRYDDLFDDDWWEHNHWYHGPILVSDPWYWWRPAGWGSVNLFINAGWSEPIDYDYGTDVIYDDDVVYVRGEPAGTPVEYTRSVVQLANPAIPAVAEAPVTEDWRPLGVWALAQEEKGDAVMFFQLSVNHDGIISGAYANVMSGEELPTSGSVDRQTQRAAWHIGDAKDKVFEAGMANLTQEQASCLVHVGKGEPQTWLLVRMPDPNLPNAPKTLSQVSE
jgi:hypothetical protein